MNGIYALQYSMLFLLCLSLLCMLSVTLTNIHEHYYHHQPLAIHPTLLTPCHHHPYPRSLYHSYPILAFCLDTSQTNLLDYAFLLPNSCYSLSKTLLFMPHYPTSTLAYMSHIPTQSLPIVLHIRLRIERGWC